MPKLFADAKDEELAELLALADEPTPPAYEGPLFETFTPLGFLDQAAEDDEGIPIKKGLNINALRGERAFRVVSNVSGEQIAVSVSNKEGSKVGRMKKQIFKHLDVPIESEYPSTI